MPIAALTDRAVLLAAGPDARTLLHNVLTVDMDAVDAHGSGYGALLTPQGKVLWDFVLHRNGDGYAFDLRSGEVEAFARRLTLYRLRSKVEIAPAPELAVLAGWEGAAGGTPDPRLPALGSRWIAAAGSVATGASVDDWHRHRIALTVPEGGVDFAFGDAFPHDAAMDSLNGVAFAKGCYIGQEVVSRMRHRGSARRRIVALEAARAEPWPEPGTDIVSADRPLGRLGSSAGDQAVGLVRLDKAAATMRARAPISAGGIPLKLSLPVWATYGWPDPAAAAED